MTEDDEKAWDAYDGKFRFYDDNEKRAFQAGRDSKGDGWCFDMDKAPLQVPCEIAYSFEGENRTKITFLEDGVCPNTGQIYGCGASWNGVNEYMLTVYAWRLANPPQPPQDRKEG